MATLQSDAHGADTEEEANILLEELQVRVRAHTNPNYALQRHQYLLTPHTGTYFMFSSTAGCAL